ncbi:uncharacterized protein I303_102286 [Kwoniella dejecticola CBS 10117]|uniref:Uncharacterized protein n=1 Tax=Kwoniella dejecticola CBS 10117 TaxID=1296121 RepID=A0A1A6ABD8_9TREE|nr:uncharacterized protein I303_01574 [Kwoniella dejecticola CBS 10117]OBR87372.1 hypothetical protein I303_01574 [Kwoniella dejecticola CBS 10117]
MPTSMYTQQSTQPSNAEADAFFFDENVSPTSALFPSNLLDPSSLLNIPQMGGPSSSGSGSGSSYNQQSPSMTASSDNQSMYHSSRLPSLSPSMQSMNLSNLSSNGQSPRSTSSPSSHSNFSLSATDEFLFNGLGNNSFDSTELDVLFQSEDQDLLYPKDNTTANYNNPGSTLFNFDGMNGKPVPLQQQQQQLFFPNQQSNPLNLDNLGGNGSLDFLQNLFNGNNLVNDDTFDMLNLDHDEKKPTAQNGQNPFPMEFDFAQQAKAIGNLTQSQSQNQNQNQSQPQWVKQEPLDQSSNQQNTWTLNNLSVHGNGHSDGFSVDGNVTVQPSAAAPHHNANVKQTHAVPRPQARQNNKGLNPAKTATEPPVVGKHNKTERRYRQKVQAAQADLRDAIPALRVLYDTSTEEQKLTTDFRAADGTVDGLGEVTRPNASAKATILIGARMYIELLQKRSAMLQRKVNELEAFRLAVAGQDDLMRWQTDFNGREAAIQAAADAAAALKMEEESNEDDDDEGDEEEEEQPKRKRTKTAAVPGKPRGKPGPKKKEQNTTLAQSAANGGLRMFAAFAVSFSFLPSASNVLQKTSTQAATNGQILPSGAIGQASTGQILSALPLITAEHTSRLLAKGLPDPIVPAPHTLVDWTWRLLVAVILAFSIGPIIGRLTRQNEKKKAGNFSNLASDCVQAVIATGTKVKKADQDQAYWVSHAAGIIGGVIKPSAVERWHVILHLHNTATDAYSLSLLAMLRPDIPYMRTAQQVWQDAQTKMTASTPLPLATVLKLPLHEVLRCAESLESTASPITALAEQVTLVHIYDLYSRLFVKLVDASTKSVTGHSTQASIKNLLTNLESCDIGSSLRSSAFDKEVRTVIEGLPKGSAAHALGLVLVGLWGIFVKPTPSAQVALATALAAEEIQGAGKGLSSISAMLDLLYPGSKDVLVAHGLDKSSVEAKLPKNALAIDKLAITCIEYIKLLISSNEVNDTALSRIQRLEASRRIQKASAHLRLTLTQTKFIGFEDHLYLEAENSNDDDDDDDSVATDGEQDEELRLRHSDLESEFRKFEIAKEQLVKVLYTVGRRAAGRMNGRDEDSGLEGDLDEL